MPTGKEIFTGLLGITAVTTLLVLLMLPLANTEWAEGMRTGMVEEGEAFEEEDAPGGIFLFVGALLKEVIFMGIPAIITLSVLRFTRRRRKKKGKQPAPA